MVNLLDSGGLLIRAPYSQAASSGKTAHYLGFDGICWPGSSNQFFEDGLVTDNHFQEIEDKFGSLDPNLNACLLYISGSHLIRPRNGEKFKFIGIDVGYFNSSYSHFSFILNELIRGLISFQKSEWTPNQFGLFDNEKDASEFLNLRTSSNDKNLEDISQEHKVGLIYTYRYINSGGR